MLEIFDNKKLRTGPDLSATFSHRHLLIGSILPTHGIPGAKYLCSRLTKIYDCKFQVI